MATNWCSHHCGRRRNPPAFQPEHNHHGSRATGYPDFFSDIFPPTPRRDAHTNCTLPLAVRGPAHFAVKLHERAEENRVFPRCDAVIAFERGFRFARPISPAVRQFQKDHIALPKFFAHRLRWRNRRRRSNRARRRDRRKSPAKRPVGFANDVEPAKPRRAAIRACSVHGEVTGISNRLLEVKRASPL